MLLPVHGYASGTHPIIVRLITEGHVTCSSSISEPRYKFTWDVNILLALLGIWFPLSNLDMKQPTLKTVALVALTSAQRSQTLAALDLEKGSEFTVK